MKSIVTAFALIALTVTFVMLRTFTAQYPQQSKRLPGEAMVASSLVEPMEPTLVGHQVCGECHAENYHLHAQSGHASTFATTSRSEIAAKFVGQRLDAGEPYGLFDYFFEGGVLRTRRLDDPHGRAFPLQFAVGSGHNAVTFLSLVADDSGETVGLEHRVSWFRNDQHFGLTPGQADCVPENELEFFGSIFRGADMHACVNCHTTTARIVDQRIEDLVPNVNCEKCHGPGSEHVRQARLTDSPPPFSVSRQDWDTESELQLCGSCHRLPENMSPRQLRDYPESMARFQPVGMLRSKCYLESDGQMSCVTCHNPHMATKAKSSDDYVHDCIRCHTDDTTKHLACPVSPRDGCVDCHMPPLTFEQGMVFHDHWIRVRKDERSLASD